MEDNRVMRRCSDARDRDIAAIVAATGMGEMQAYYHLQGRRAVQEALRRGHRA